MWRFRGIIRTFSDVYYWLIPLVMINLAWLVLSLTVILWPPATAALYTATWQPRSGSARTGV